MSCGKPMLTRYFTEYAAALKKHIKHVRSELKPQYQNVTVKYDNALQQAKIVEILHYVIKIDKVVSFMQDSVNIVSTLTQPLDYDASESLANYINNLNEVITSIPDAETIGEIADTYVGNVQKTIYTQLLENVSPLTTLYELLVEYYTQWSEDNQPVDSDVLDTTSKYLQQFRESLKETFNLIKEYIPDYNKELYTYQSFKKDMASIRSKGELMLGNLNKETFAEILGASTTETGESTLRDCCAILIADAVRRGIAPGVDKPIDERRAFEF
jgi:flagellin-specific chaperone FliS